MATTTNYLNDLASMRQFIRSLTFGNHNRGKATSSWYQRKPARRCDSSP